MRIFLIAAAFISLLSFSCNSKIDSSLLFGAWTPVVEGKSETDSVMSKTIFYDTDTLVVEFSVNGNVQNRTYTPFHIIDGKILEVGPDSASTFRFEILKLTDRHLEVKSIGEPQLKYRYKRVKEK